MQTLTANHGGNNTVNTENAPPKWLVLHGGHPENIQRRRWGDDMARIADTLVKTGQWLIWREGDDVQCIHRSRVLA